MRSKGEGTSWAVVKDCGCLGSMCGMFSSEPVPLNSIQCCKPALPQRKKIAIYEQTDLLHLIMGTLEVALCLAQRQKPSWQEAKETGK